MAKNDVNEVLLSGYVPQDPKVFGTDNKVVRFSLGMSDYKGEKQYLNVVAFGKVAEIVEAHVKRGTQLTVRGAIKVRSYEKDGATVWTTDIIMDKLYFNGGNNESNDTDEEEDEEEVAVVKPAPATKQPYKPNSTKSTPSAPTRTKVTTRKGSEDDGLPF